MLGKYEITVFAIALLFAHNCLANCSDVTLTSKVDYSRLWKDLQTLSSDEMEGRKPGSTGSVKAQHYIEKQFSRIGLSSFTAESKYSTPFSFDVFMGQVTGVNIIGWLKGTDYPQQYIVVSAHYDHLGRSGRDIYNGADDNASGVAAMITIADVLQREGAQHSVIFIATDAEEDGLFGAKAFLQNPPVEVSSIRFNLNLDMLSQGGRRKHLYVTGARRYPQFRPVVNQVIEQAGMCIKSGHKMQSRGMRPSHKIDWHQASDHAAFARQGIPYLFVGVADHKHYHQASDIAENIEPNFYYAAVESSLLILQKMDSLK